MFNFSKKKEPTVNVDQKLIDEKNVIEQEVEKEIMVHVMPEHFRTLKNDAGKAKATGLIILIAGFLFLAATSIGLYYYLFEYSAKEAEVEPIEEVKQVEEVVKTIPTSTPVIATSSIITVIATTTIATTSEQVEQTIASTTTSVLAKDNDSDGLTDPEERLLGTNMNSSDSDGDGYSDIEETRKLYNPAGSGKIEANQAIKQYTSEKLGYSLLRPADWLVREVDDSIIFTAPDNHIIQINSQPNQNQQTIADWYKQEFNLISLNESRIIKHKDSKGQTDWQGIKNDDNSTLYLIADGKEIITVNYNLGLDNILNYPNIFQLVIDSFTVGVK